MNIIPTFFEHFLIALPAYLQLIQKLIKFSSISFLTFCTEIHDKLLINKLSKKKNIYTLINFIYGLNFCL